MENPNATAIDGFYLNESRTAIYLFQMTIGDRHPVEGTGIIDLLNRLEIPIPPTNGFQVYLVFYVSRGMAKSFTSQDIHLDSKTELLAANVAQVNGMGPVRTQELAKMNSFKVEELAAEMNKKPELQKQFGKLVDKYLEKTPDDVVEFVTGIPQYIIETDIDFRKSILDKSTWM